MEVGVVIPDEYVGRIIGKAGNRIAKIRERCTAEVLRIPTVGLGF